MAMEAEDARERVVLYNPVPVALAHYEAELRAVLEAAGFVVSAVHTQNEGLTGQARLRAAVAHVRRSRELLATNDCVITVWPLLGWLELLFARTRAARKYLVIHDPLPLRSRDLTSGRRVGRFVSSLTRPNVTLVVHSSQARRDALSVLAGRAEIVTIPHPILPVNDRVAAVHAVNSAPTVGVFGQYKTARDLELLAQLGSHLRRHGWSGVVRGRNWPSVPGWDVDSRFLPEDELTEAISSVNAVLVPYERYYQSGIALRAIECGTPVVGRRNPFLEEFLGTQYPGLVDGQGVVPWLKALDAVQAGSTEAAAPFEMNVRAWKAGLMQGSQG